MDIHPVDQYLLNRPEKDRDLMLFLDDWLRTQHGLTTKIRYGIPFYDYKVWLCYLNPIKSGGVNLVFLQGVALNYHHPRFEQRGRKMVKGFDFTSIEDVPMEILEEVMSIAKRHQERSRS